MVEASSALPDALAEIERLRLMLNGDHVEAMDRVIGMLERAEAEIRLLRAEAIAFQDMVDLCPSCSPLVEVPFGGCVHNRDGHPVDLHGCHNQPRHCTCCASCTAECHRLSEFES